MCHNDLMKESMSDWIDLYAAESGAPLYCMEPRKLFDRAIVGVVDVTVVYDRRTVINLLMEDSEMSYEDATEYHYFNQDAVDYWMFLDCPELPEINDTTFPKAVCDPSLN